MKKLLVGLMLMLFVFVSSATTDSPYQGQQRRTIKSLSQKDIDGYLSGKGMGFAKAAELNHYPGPRHVLDLADKLGLSEDQQDKTQILFDAMKTEAMKVGQQLVMKEQQLNELFATGKINPSRLDSTLQQIGALHAKLRYIHLATHLQQKEIMTKQQIHQYDKLRGYGGKSHDSHMHNH